MTAPLRDQLAEIIYDAVRLTVTTLPDELRLFERAYEHERDWWREVADAVLTCEERRVREAVVEAAVDLLAYMGPDASPHAVWKTLDFTLRALSVVEAKSLARLDAGKEEGR